MILVNKFATPILSVFREYLATKALSSGTIDLNLQEDTKVRAFLRCVDCPDVFEKLCKFWNETLMYFKIKTPNFIKKIKLLKSKSPKENYRLFKQNN